MRLRFFELNGVTVHFAVTLGRDGIIFFGAYPSRLDHQNRVELRWHGPVKVGWSIRQCEWLLRSFSGFWLTSAF